MGGAAAVLGAARAVAALAPPGVEAHFVVASCENMIGSRGLRPGDILTASNGKTIEVNNTDAEGRLTLADALVYAQRQGATEVVDIATLTGACMAALGTGMAGLFTPSDELAAALGRSAAAAGEKLWRMPLEEEYFEQLNSPLADIKNLGMGKACAREFVFPRVVVFPRGVCAPAARRAALRRRLGVTALRRAAASAGRRHHGGPVPEAVYRERGYLGAPGPCAADGPPADRTNKISRSPPCALLTPPRALAPAGHRWAGVGREEQLRDRVGRCHPGCLGAGAQLAQKVMSGTACGCKVCWRRPQFMCWHNSDSGISPKTRNENKECYKNAAIMSRSTGYDFSGSYASMRPHFHSSSSAPSSRGPRCASRRKANSVCAAGGQRRESAAPWHIQMKLRPQCGGGGGACRDDEEHNEKLDDAAKPKPDGHEEGGHEQAAAHAVAAVAVAAAVQRRRVARGHDDGA